MKPMKEVSMKEAAILCHLKGLETMNWRGWGGERDGRKGGASSIEMLTEGESIDDIRQGLRSC